MTDKSNLMHNSYIYIYVCMISTDDIFKCFCDIIVVIVADVVSQHVFQICYWIGLWPK